MLSGIASSLPAGALQEGGCRKNRGRNTLQPHFRQPEATFSCTEPGLDAASGRRCQGRRRTRPPHRNSLIAKQLIIQDLGTSRADTSGKRWGWLEANSLAPRVYVKC